MRKTIYFFPFIIFLACGIEVPQGIPRLNSPNGVVVNHKGADGITITWWGLNPEDDFSGYNIYYADNTNTAVSQQGTKITNLSGESGKPTLEIPLPFFTASNFSFTIDRSNYEEIMQQYSTKNIFIYIKAFSTLRNAESVSSVPTEGKLLP